MCDTAIIDTPYLLYSMLLVYGTVRNMLINLPYLN